MLLSYQEIVLRLFVALIIGSILGFERTQSKKPAGIRTHALVCIAATMISMISAFGFGEFSDPTNTTFQMDPARLIVGIVTGIGFLGAGIIWKDTSRGDVRGLTTAANIWASAALGIAVGLGHYFLAFATVAMMQLALRVAVVLLKLGLLKHEDEGHDRRVFHSSRD